MWRISTASQIGTGSSQSDAVVVGTVVAGATRTGFGPDLVEESRRFDRCLVAGEVRTVELADKVGCRGKLLADGDTATQVEASIVARLQEVGTPLVVDVDGQIELVLAEIERLRDKRRLRRAAGPGTEQVQKIVSTAVISELWHHLSLVACSQTGIDRRVTTGLILVGSAKRGCIVLGNQRRTNKRR